MCLKNSQKSVFAENYDVTVKLTLEHLHSSIVSNQTFCAKFSQKKSVNSWVMINNVIYEVKAPLTWSFWPPNLNQLILESKWMFVSWKWDWQATQSIMSPTTAVASAEIYKDTHRSSEFLNPRQSILKSINQIKSIKLVKTGNLHICKRVTTWAQLLWPVLTSLEHL